MNKKESALLGGHQQQGSNLTNCVNLHAILRNVKSGSIWEKIYYDPLLTGGYRGIFPLSEDSEPLFTSSPDDFFLREFENISIDRIVILFGAPSIGKDATRRWWRKFDTMISAGVTEMLSGGPLYRNSCKWFHHFFVQWECVQNRLETIRLEFNPNKADLSSLEIFFSILGGNALRFARVSRLDVAIDYAIYLNPLCWLVKNTPYSARFEYDSKLKTRYFGAPSSDVQIRVYDKAFELKCNGEGEVNFDFWRVEAQVKAIAGETFGLLEHSTVCGFNPFSRLEFYDPYGFKYEGQGLYSLFVTACIARDVSYAASELDKDTKKKYLARLKADTGKLSFNSPCSIYRNIFPEVYRRFVDRLRNLFQSGQQKGQALLMA